MPKRKKVNSSKQREKISQTKDELSQEQETKDAGKESSGGMRNLGDLARDVVVSYNARVKVVGEIIEDTHRVIGEFKERRENMSKELREVLSQCESLRKKDFDQMMADILFKQNEREMQVKKMLEDFRREEEIVAEKLKNLLKKGEGIRIRDFKKVMAEIKIEQDRRTKETSTSIVNELQNMREEVYKMLDNFKKERQSVATAWHEIIGLFRWEKAEANPGNESGQDQAENKSDSFEREAVEESNQEYDQEKNQETKSQ